MRELTSHKVNPANDVLQITVEDEPGAGGANHLYVINGFNALTNASDPDRLGSAEPATQMTVLFQNGPIPEKGTNGVTHEALLAIIEDRLASFQLGKYACSENAQALHHIREAQRILQSRTKARMERGVEGTHQV